MIGFAATVSKSWIANAIDVAFDRDYYFDPKRRHSIDAKCNAYLRESGHPLDLFFTESNLGRLEFYEPQQVLIGGIQPNMIIGLLAGADFIPNDKMDADISPAPLAGQMPDEFPPPQSMIEHAVIQQFTDQFYEVQSDSDASLAPIPPFFWDGSGRAAIHGPLTTAMKLFGESILLDLLAEPDRARSIIDWTANVSIELVRHFATLGRREIDEVHIGECSGCMIAPEIFNEFVVPTVSRVGRQLGPVRLHSCGPSDRLLKSFLGVENLHSLDVGGDTTVAKIREIFGSNQQFDIAPLVDDLLDPSPDPLMAWADRVLEQNAGGPMNIVCHIECGYDLFRLQALKQKTKHP